MNKTSVLITGASGFIGNALCRELSLVAKKIIGVDVTSRSLNNTTTVSWEQIDLTDKDSVITVCQRHSPDVVIHCAGIAHQKIGAVDSATYMRVNSEATENLARAASMVNPDVQFIFFSSVSVYGEDNMVAPVSEEQDYRPSSDYAISKMDAEQKLLALVDEGVLSGLVILRLAPVYDRDWSLNLDRRVFSPGKLVYLRFGSGLQRMSALARPNLVGFIVHLLQSTKAFKLRILNVCDTEPYAFNTIIRVFKESGIHPSKPVLPVPLFVVLGVTRIASIFFPNQNKKEWIHSCYNKLASDLVFDNRKMLETGFRHTHSLEKVFRFSDISLS